MIRIWLTADDIARTRLEPDALPLHEVFLSLAAARTTADATLAGWRAGLRGRMPATAWPLFELGTATSFPDFLAPLRADGLAAGLAALAATPAMRIAADLDDGTATPAGSRWRRALAAGDSTARRLLLTGVRDYHDACVAGELAAHEPLVRVDVAARGRALIGGGVEALFASLHPMLRWHNPVLVVENGTDLDLRPNGRGITLVPSVFASRPWVGTDPDAAFVAYPVRRSAPGPGPRPQLAGDPLVALLGRSRAAVLRAAGNGATTTTDLARRAGISTPSASQHASVLRDAGLLDTTRRGKAAHHSLTVLAKVLLAA